MMMMMMTISPFTVRSGFQRQEEAAGEELLRLERHRSVYNSITGKRVTVMLS